MSSSPAAPTPGGPSLPGPEPTASQLLQMLVGTLSRLVHPSIAPGIIRAAAADAGIDLTAYDIKEPPPQVQGKKTKDKAAKTRATQPYHIFVKKVMDRMKEDPAYNQNLPIGANGKPIHVLSLPSVLWKQLGDEKREAFVKAYHPLCDTVTSERASGLKTGQDIMLAKVHAFEATFDAATKDLLKSLLPASLAHLSGGAVAAVPVEAQNNVHDDSGEESEEDEDSDDEAEAEAKAAEAKRIEDEAKAKAAEEAKKKKEKEEHEAKKAAKQLAAAAVAPATAPGAVQEEKKAKKKRKGHEDQPGSAKKPSKDKA